MPGTELWKVVPPQRRPQRPPVLLSDLPYASLATEWLKRWQLGGAPKALTGSRRSCDGIEAWLAGVGLRALAADWGIQRTRAFLNRHGHRNGGRVLSKYTRFLPAGTGISAARLFEIYRGSVERQLRAA